MPLTASQLKSLRQSPLFLGCNVSHYTSLFQSLEPYVLSKGESLSINLPFANRSLCILLSGEVEYSINDGVVLAFFQSPFCFTLNTLHSYPSIRLLPKIQARSTVATLTFIPYDELENTMRADAILAANMLRIQAATINLLNNVIFRFTASSPSIRLAILLLQSAVTDEFDASFGISKLALSLDVSRATLYRAFNELEQAGLIHRVGKTIQIQDREKLIQYVETQQSANE